MEINNSDTIYNKETTRSSLRTLMYKPWNFILGMFITKNTGYFLFITFTLFVKNHYQVLVPPNWGPSEGHCLVMGGGSTSSNI